MWGNVAYLATADKRLTSCIFYKPFKKLFCFLGGGLYLKIIRHVYRHIPFAMAMFTLQAKVVQIDFFAHM